VIEAAIRVSQYVEVLNTVVNEVCEYQMWQNWYGDDFVKRVREIKQAINKLYEQKDNCTELNIRFSFMASQLFKKMILYYINRNYQKMQPREMKELIDFIVTIDNRLEDDLQQNFNEYMPRIEALNKKDILN
jgi:hypothetical protein